ncbi:EAL domain-containing protein [Paenibacillus albiflavus]|uniref:EAL domain-containing protein n=1 Tax=Paenibacillus albiflavus TaxID=2545760 RepID=A0A4R4E8K7_9BACL|nr:EAL domain-containing protein [Paenibacillus albiflavus]TCZ76126.1 EAL domain-containing protein [Paenibacillus albiflavus]
MVTWIYGFCGGIIFIVFVMLVYKRICVVRTQQMNKPEPDQSLFDTLFINSMNGVAVLDCDERIIRVNSAFKNMLGYMEEEILQKSLGSFVLEEDQPLSVQAKLQQQPGAGVTGLMTAAKHEQGYRVELKSSAVPVILDETAAQGYLVICEDVTERKRFGEHIRHMSFYDDMTGLPNRQLFQEELSKLLRTTPKQEGNKLAVFYADVIDFRIINESFGFEHGNMVLLQLAERFMRCIGENDILARSEGDQFAFCYPNVKDIDHALELAQSIASVMEQPFVVDQQEVYIYICIGIVLHLNEKDTADILMKNANIALTQAKDKEKSNIQVFHVAMETYSIQRLKLENELRHAISNQEFILHYQPQVDIHTGQIIGMEALVRWMHPTKGMIPPKEFIPLAEETGFIVQLGDWVLYEACRQNKAWQDQGLLHVPVSVNLSMRQFSEHGIKNKISEVLVDTGLPPKYLEIEITESMTMDVKHASDWLNKLKKLGVQVAIDDFGTGYSSLSYIKQFPIDKLKIDRSFVNDMLLDPNNATIVSTIIAMTRQLNLKVIAEGVETKEQLQFLQEKQCDEVQGFLFSPPVPSDTMGSLLEQAVQ